MSRNVLIGTAVVGVTAALAGLVWTVYEFPFAIVLPAALGWYAVSLRAFGARKAAWAALVGGLAFTGVLLVGMFFAITDGSPVAITGWIAAVLAAVLAGALTGAVLDARRGPVLVAAYSGAGMLLATVAVALLRSVAPAGIDQPGLAQYAYFAFALGVVGVFMGAAIGAGVSAIAPGPKPRSTGSVNRHHARPV